MAKRLLTSTSFSYIIDDNKIANKHLCYHLQKRRIGKVSRMTYANFGDFIAKKRVERKITVRKMAEMLGVSAPFLTDVEKDRRNPFDYEKLVKVADILQLSDEERDLMFDLAGKKRDTVAPDLPDYIMDHDYVSAALRTARDLGAGEEEWNKFVEDLKKREG